ncbi:hypothetical protein Aduo_015191 [Ancylostoma duodenale]
MASVLNEDDLLRTPEEADSQDEMDLEEAQTNDSVSALYNEEFEKLAARILGQLNMVGITRDSELGKSNRRAPMTQEGSVSWRLYRNRQL